MVRIESYLFYVSKKKRNKLSNVCLKPSKCSQLTKIHHVEGLENPLKNSENINYVKLFISYFRTNEANAPMGV